MVFCTEFVDGWWSGEPLSRSCLRCGARHHPHRTHDLRIGSLPCCIKLAFHIISAKLISISKYRTFNHRRQIVARNVGRVKTTVFTVFFKFFISPCPSFYLCYISSALLFFRTTSVEEQSTPGQQIINSTYKFYFGKPSTL